MGDGTNERSGRPACSASAASKLGDIVSSSPLFVGAPPFRYRDKLEGRTAASYFQFRDNNLDRTKVVYAAPTTACCTRSTPKCHTPPATTGPEGKEMFAYVPGAVFKNLAQLASPAYTHRYYVDGAPTWATCSSATNGTPCWSAA